MNRVGRSQYHKSKKNQKEDYNDNIKQEQTDNKQNNEFLNRSGGGEDYEALTYSQKNIDQEVELLESALSEDKENIAREIETIKASNQRLAKEVEKMSRRQRELEKKQKAAKKNYHQAIRAKQKEQDSLEARAMKRPRTYTEEQSTVSLQGTERRYIAGIDGLRTLAVLGVILYHLMPSSMKGGYLGVTLFFVISGYLMIDIIYTQVKKNSFSLKQFYMRRIRRLLPAVVILFVLCGAFIPYINKDFLVHFRAVVTTSLLNVNNWWQLATGGDYFDKFAQVAPFENLWSLSVEGQFYLIYPIIFAFLLRKLGWRWSTFILVAGTILSSVEMSWLYDPKNVTRIYYGTDTRLFSLLVGAIIALVIREKGDKIAKALKGKIGTLLASTTLLVTLWSFFSVADQEAYIYQGGMLAFTIVYALLMMMIIVNPRIENWFIHPFFKWCGSRSYEIYLWQYPVIVIMDKLWQVPQSQAFAFALAKLLVVIALSEVTHRIVQMFYRFLELAKMRGFRRASNTYLPMWVATTVMLGLFVYGFYQAPTKIVAANNNLEATLKENEKQLKEQQKKQKALQAKQKAAQKNKPKQPQTQKEKLQQEVRTQLQKINKGQVNLLPLNPKERQAAAAMDVTAIGDSVLLNSSLKLNKLMPNMTIDAKVGRQILDAFPMVDQMKAEGSLAPVVLIALGTNGPTYNESDFDHMMKQLKGKQVFFVNTKSNLYWQDEVNEKLQKAAKKYPNTHIIDWHGVSKNQTSWFGDDGTHMVDPGSKAYAEYVAKNLIAYS